MIIERKKEKKFQFLSYERGFPWGGSSMQQDSQVRQLATVFDYMCTGTTHLQYLAENIIERVVSDMGTIKAHGV